MRAIKNSIKKYPWLFHSVMYARYTVTTAYNLVFFRRHTPAVYFVFTGKKLVYVVNAKVAQTAIINTCGVTNPKEYSGVQDRTLGYKTTHLRTHDNEYLFTFVRNPFERLYSCWKSKYITDQTTYKKQYSDFQYYLFGWFKKKTSFEQFATRVCALPDWASDIHFVSQHYLLYESNSHTLDFVGRFEHIATEFKPIQQRFNLFPLPHLNKSQDSQEEWKDAYTPELVELVYERYKNDCDTWYPDAKAELLTHRPLQ